MKAWIKVAIIGALFGGCVVVEHRAEVKARAFCSRFTVGGDFNQAIEAVNASGAYHRAYERSGERTAYVSYMGIPPFSRHMCFIRGVGNKIVRLSYDHFD